MTNITSWIKRNLVSRYMMAGCEKEKECLRLLETILDSEASKLEEKEYYGHIESCWTCYQNYNLEVALKELIRTRIERKAVPDDLLAQIKLEIERSDSRDSGVAGKEETPGI